jgi:hypothetical protein
MNLKSQYSTRHLLPDTDPADTMPQPFQLAEDLSSLLYAGVADVAPKAALYR